MTVHPLFYVLHVFSVISLLGVSCAATAHPLADQRKKFLMFSGIASLGVFISGFGIAGMGQFGFPLWVIVKILCWLAISATAGLFFRYPQKAKTYLIGHFALALTALLMVYFKPF